MNLYVITVIRFEGYSRYHLMYNHHLMFSLRRKRGQGLIEISVIISLVAIAALLILTLMGTTVSQVFSNVVCDVQGADPSVFPGSPCANLTPSPSTTLPGTGGNYLVVEDWGGAGPGGGLPIPVNTIDNPEYFGVHEYAAGGADLGYLYGVNSVSGGTSDAAVLTDGAPGDACVPDGYTYFLCTFTTADTGGSVHTMTATFPGDTPGTLPVTVYAPVLTTLTVNGQRIIPYLSSDPDYSSAYFSFNATGLDQFGNSMGDRTSLATFTVTQTDTAGSNLPVSDGTCTIGSGGVGNNFCNPNHPDFSAGYKWSYYPANGDTTYHTVTATIGSLHGTLDQITYYEQAPPVVTNIYTNQNDSGISTSDYGVWPGMYGNLYSDGGQPAQTIEFGNAWYGNGYGSPPVYANDQYGNPISVTASQFDFSVQITTDGGATWTTENTCTANQPPCYANVADPTDFYTTAPFTQSQFHRIVATYIATGANSTTDGYDAGNYAEFYSPQIAEAFTHTATQIVNYLYFGGKMLSTAPSDWTYTIKRYDPGTNTTVVDGTCTSTACTPLTADSGGSWHIIYPIYVGSVPQTTADTNGRPAFDSTNNDTSEVNYRQTHFYYVPS